MFISNTFPNHFLISQQGSFKERQHLNIVLSTLYIHGLTTSWLNLYQGAPAGVICGYTYSLGIWLVVSLSFWSRTTTAHIKCMENGSRSSPAVGGTGAPQTIKCPSKCPGSLQMKFNCILLNSSGEESPHQSRWTSTEILAGFACFLHLLKGNFLLLLSSTV